MDQSIEEMRFMGSTAIIKQSFKTILTWKKLFTQITLTFILPLVIVFIAHMELSKRLFSPIEENPYQMFTDTLNSFEHYYEPETDITRTDWLHYLLFKTTTLVTLIVFTLLSTAAVAFTVASIFTGCDVTFRKSLKVVPKVWKRLALTFLFMFLTFFGHNSLFAAVFFLCFVIVSGSVYYPFVSLAVLLGYVSGLLYLSITWQVAGVVSVLENCSGLKAMIKGVELMKGKVGLGLEVSVLLYTVLGGEVAMYMTLVLYDVVRVWVVWRVVVGVVCWGLFLVTFLLIMVIQTVLYLVCKSHHREAIDKVGLSTYLGAFLGEPQPALKMGEEIQLGGGGGVQVQVQA